MNLISVSNDLKAWTVTGKTQHPYVEVNYEGDRLGDETYTLDELKEEFQSFELTDGVFYAADRYFVLEKWWQDGESS